MAEVYGGEGEEVTIEYFTQRRPTMPREGNTPEVTIEYCTRRTFHTRYSPEKYDHYFLATRAALQERLPRAKVTGNPDGSKNRLPVATKDPTGKDSIGSRVQSSGPRLGAFEVTLVSDKTGSRRLFSKLQSGRWPNPQALARRAEELLQSGGNGSEGAGLLEGSVNEKAQMLPPMTTTPTLPKRPCGPLAPLHNLDSKLKNTTWGKSGRPLPSMMCEKRLKTLEDSPFLPLAPRPPLNRPATSPKATSCRPVKRPVSQPGPAGAVGATVSPRGQEISKNAKTAPL